MAKGNPNWGKPESLVVAPTLTEFERTVSEFNLSPNEYVNSNHLRQWAEQNCNYRYVPEYLLRAWNLEVVCTW